MRQINESVLVSEAYERLPGEICKSSLKLNRPVRQARARCQRAPRCSDLQVITVTSNFAPRSLPTEECPEITAAAVPPPHARPSSLAYERIRAIKRTGRQQIPVGPTEAGVQMEHLYSRQQPWKIEL